MPWKLSIFFFLRISLSLVWKMAVSLETDETVAAFLCYKKPVNMASLFYFTLIFLGLFVQGKCLIVCIVLYLCLYDEHMSCFGFRTSLNRLVKL